MCWIVAITVGRVRSRNFSNASETPAAVWGGVSRLPGVSARDGLTTRYSRNLQLHPFSLSV